VLIAACKATVRMGERLFCGPIASRIFLFDFGSLAMAVWQALSVRSDHHPPGNFALAQMCSQMQYGSAFQASSPKLQGRLCRPFSFRLSLGRPLLQILNFLRTRPGWAARNPRFVSNMRLWD
jgi:hypothetical protein